MLPYAAAVGAGDLARVDQLLSSNLYGGQFMSYDPGAVRWMEHAETHRWPQGHPTDLDYLHATAR